MSPFAADVAPEFIASHKKNGTDQLDLVVALRERVQRMLPRFALRKNFNTIALAAHPLLFIERLNHTASVSPIKGTQRSGQFRMIYSKIALRGAGPHLPGSVEIGRM